MPAVNPTGQQADEAGLTFLPNGTAVMVIRRDWAGTLSVGVSTGNYTNWTITSANIQVESPDLLTLPDGRIVCAGRMTKRYALYRLGLGGSEDWDPYPVLHVLQYGRHGYGLPRTVLV